MARRIHITLTDEQFSFLKHESELTSISVAELTRRAIDTTYGVTSPRTVHLITHAAGRRAGIALDGDDAWSPRPA